MSGERRVSITDEQRVFLRWLPDDGRWAYQSIDRSGSRKWWIAARQQCRRKGLAESHPDLRRTWRITVEGLSALGRPARAAP